MIFVICIFDKSLYPRPIWINQPVRPRSHYFFKDKSLLSNSSSNNLMGYIHYNSKTWIFFRELMEIGIIEECPDKKIANAATTNSAYWS